MICPIKWSDFSHLIHLQIKVWSIAGDVLCPGHQYEIGTGGGIESMPNFSKTK